MYQILNNIVYKITRGTVCLACWPAVPLIILFAWAMSSWAMSGNSEYDPISKEAVNEAGNFLMVLLASILFLGLGVGWALLWSMLIRSVV